MSFTLHEKPGPAGRARRRWITSAIVLVLIGVVIAVIQALAAEGQFDARLWEPLWTTPGLAELLLIGLWNTLLAAGLATALAIPLGIVLAFGRMSRSRVLRVPLTLLVQAIRGVPPLLLIFFFFLGLPLAAGIDLPSLWYLVLGLAVYNGAVISELLRGGLLAIPHGQTEAGYSLGFTRVQVLWMILLPQAVRIMLPALISQLVILLKETTLGFIIGYDDLLRRSTYVVLNLHNALQVYALIAIAYLILNGALEAIAIALDKRARRTYNSAPTVDAAIEA